MGRLKTSIVTLVLASLMLADVATNRLRAQSSSATDSGFTTRCNRLLDVVSQERDRGFFTVAAKLKEGRDKTFALAMLDSLTTDESIGGMFYSYMAIGTYLRLKDKLPDSPLKKIRQAYRQRTMYF